MAPLGADRLEISKRGWRGAMKHLVYWLAKYTGVFALCRWITRKDVRVLCYHGIWIGQGEHFGNFLYMSPEKFSNRMAQLKRLGYPVITLDEALQRLEQDELEDCSTAITIDDGWFGSYQHMVPALEAQRFPAMIYLTTYYCEKQTPVFDVAIQYMVARSRATHIDLAKLGIGSNERLVLQTDSEKNLAIERLQEAADEFRGVDARREFVRRVGSLLAIDYTEIEQGRWFHLMSPEQVTDSAQRGMDFQLHTHRHRLSHRGESTLVQELADNRKSLAPLVRGDQKHFCYPSGIYEKSDWPALEASGVISATTTEMGFVTKSSNRYALPRLLDGQEVSNLEFEAELSGFGEIKRRLRSSIGG